MLDGKRKKALGKSEIKVSLGYIPSVDMVASLSHSLKWCFACHLEKGKE
jgi:hypothetical protein